jgi:hypothetical protein
MFEKVQRNTLALLSPRGRRSYESRNHAKVEAMPAMVVALACESPDSIAKVPAKVAMILSARVWPR